MEASVDFNLHWEEVVIKNSPKHENETMCNLDSVQSYSTMTSEEIIADTDQMAAENLMFLSQDVVGYTEPVLPDELNVECVTEEVITDDWVLAGGQERVEVPMEQLVHNVSDVKVENDIDVPLPTDQDQYTAMRPWPCDFCSRRFRKKAALMNHMVAHQNDRPHACNLCGVRYVRKCDLMNHLKVHAFVPDNHDTMDYDDVINNSPLLKPKKKRGRRKKNPEPEEDGVWENMTSARTQQWQRRARTPVRRSPSPPSEPDPPPEPSPPSPPSPLPPTDPSRPFVCRHCGVGFAREKALQSHSRIHGGDSPVECGDCGELYWSREALAAHAAHKHPHAAPRARRDPSYELSNSDDDYDYRMSLESSSERTGYEARGPELRCQDCGVAFQRVDLLRRHVAAAHNYKRHDSTSSAGGGGGGGAWGWGEHACDVCGETFADPLQLLAHAEGHAERHRPNSTRLKRMGRGKTTTASSNNSRQFPCRECGKVFGSRSSQQIHVRIHTGERPYACRFCWKAFADGGTLRKHERIHTGEKPYGCAVCPRAFNQRVVLREHVRSHHSAPNRRTNGSNVYTCVVCDRTLHSSVELVQHLIQHCDANTALKRQPQNGPRKYKRRRKLKTELVSPKREWEEPERASSPSAASGASRSPPRASPPPSPPRRLASPPRRAPPPPRRRRRRAPPAPPRPRMIHTEEARPRTKQVRGRKSPRQPADDLRAIAVPASPASPSPPSPPSPSMAHASPDSPDTMSPRSTHSPHSPAGPFKCEMCSLEFEDRDALLLHVPVHI
ncbi:PREDICTED: zinc finger protein 358-like isoform X1 [Papilio xuthus]|uniref:Zinc finger protein 358-like isoform X1 n=1 Tax=Papilio xuthus TaxID=66420 RepID=A0AAJ6Z417_PAPXU|nr:PREDICTED: zinc finger protein 358-like isoform X1 [Papilio xuthus]